MFFKIQTKEIVVKKKQKIYSIIFLSIFLWIIYFAIGANSSLASSRSWYKISYSISSPHNASPAWHIDPLIAKEIFAPAMSAYGSRIDFWHFRRQSNRDGTGHQFSFVFYAKKKTAKKIFRLVQNSAVLQKLKERQIINRERYKETNKYDAEYSEDGRNHNLRNIWSEYVTGISNTWLKLIFIYSRKNQSGTNMIEHYRFVHRQISRAWQEQNQHTFMNDFSDTYNQFPFQNRY